MSTSGQILDRQTCSLTEADCIRVLPDKLSDKTTDQPELTACLDYLRGAVDASGVNKRSAVRRAPSGSPAVVTNGAARRFPRVNMRPLV